MLSVPDGRRVTTLINATPIHDPDGPDDALASVVVTLQDLAPLQEIERMRAEFLGMVSHELRAPLTSIKGSAATALGTARLVGPAEVAQFFRIIDEQADRMDSLIGDLHQAIALMDEAIEIVQTQRLPNGAADPVKPPYELYGEILMELDRPGAAAEQFETSLLRMPGRARSLLGAAQAAAASGDSETARERYATLLSFWRGPSDHPGVEEARRFTMQNQE